MPDQQAPQEDELPPSDAPTRRKVSLPPAALVGAVLGGILVVAIIALAIRSAFLGGEPAGIPLAVTRALLSASPSPAAPPVVEVGDTQLALPVPVTLDVGGRSLPVQASSPEAGDPWTASPSQPGAVTWAYGTVINYVLGLAPTSENQATLSALEEDDPVQLRLSSGTRLTFSVRARRQLPPDDPSILSQSHPGLTLVLISDEEQWLVITADFETATEDPSPAGGTSAGVGQAVQVGDVRVTVTEGRAVRGLGGVPPGTMVYLVEFFITNSGSTPLNAQDFATYLVDGVGNRYLFSPTASTAGTAGPLQGSIPPGQQASGTAGYIVPETLAGPSLTWVFSPQPASGLQARIALSFTPGDVVPVAAEVTVLEAFLADDGDVLHIVARIRNAGDVALNVSADGVSLSSSAGAGELLLAAPPFPWMVGSGDTREVEVQFARPDASTAVVTILGFAFEVSGLP